MLLARAKFRGKITVDLPSGFSKVIEVPNTFIDLSIYPAGTVYQTSLLYSAFDPPGSNIVMSSFQQNGIFNGTTVVNFGSNQFNTVNVGPFPVNASFGLDPSLQGVSIFAANPVGSGNIQRATFDFSVAISIPSSYSIAG